MKHTTLIGLAFSEAILAIVLLGGCSSSTPPANTYPLTLTIDSEANAFNSAIFYFHVTRNSVALQGAKLRRTNFPSDQTYDLGIQSDSNGNFPRVTLILSGDTSAVAYQAIRDTLSSNYIRWPE